MALFIVWLSVQDSLVIINFQFIWNLQVDSNLYQMGLPCQQLVFCTLFHIGKIISISGKRMNNKNKTDWNVLYEINDMKVHVGTCTYIHITTVRYN